MLGTSPQEHVRLYNERFDYLVEFIETGQIWFDNDMKINLALKKLREIYADFKKNATDREHKHGWIYDLTRALSVTSRPVNVTKIFNMLHKANSAYLERQVSTGSGQAAISKRNCPFMTFLTLRLDPHVFNMPLNTTTFSHVKKQPASIQITTSDIDTCLAQMTKDNISLAQVMGSMSPGTEPEFLGRLAQRLLGSVSIEQLQPVMPVPELIAHYQLHLDKAHKHLIESSYMLRLIHMLPQWRIWLRSKISVLRLCNREEFEFMYFVRVKLKHYWPGKRELIQLIEKRQITNIDQIDPSLFKWAHREQFETKKQYAIWLFVLRNDNQFVIDPAGNIALKHHAIIKPERIEPTPLASSTPPPPATTTQQQPYHNNVLYRLFDVKVLKTRTIDQVLTNLKKKYSPHLVFNCARFIQYDLCLAFHCNNDEKIDAYRHFLSDVFLKTVFKVNHFNELCVDTLGPLLLTEDNIDSESIGAHLGIVTTTTRKRMAPDDNDNDDDDEPITESLARMKSMDDAELKLEGVETKRKKLNIVPIVKTERHAESDVPPTPPPPPPVLAPVSKTKPKPFKASLTHEEALHVYRWANGLVIKFSQMVQNIRVSTELDGISQQLLTYLASLHAYVNGGHFEFGSFLGRLACYYKTNGEMEGMQGDMDGIYYFPVEYDVPRIDGDWYEKLETRVSSILGNADQLFRLEGDQLRLVDNCQSEVKKIYASFESTRHWRWLDDWLPDPDMLFNEPFILDEEPEDDDGLDVKSLLELIVEHGVATYGRRVKVRVLDTLRDAINAQMMLVFDLARIEASKRFSEIKQLLSTTFNSAYSIEWIDDHMYIEFN